MNTSSSDSTWPIDESSPSNHSNSSTTSVKIESKDQDFGNSGIINNAFTPNTPMTVRNGQNNGKNSVYVRHPVRLDDLENRFGRVPFGRQMSTTYRAYTQAESSVKNCSLFHVILNFFPILSWLREYDFKNDLIADLMAGLTVSALHVPQGMAYGLLAGVSPISGLYVSFFPVIVYAIMGTSRHSSIGTFAVASIMTQNVINKMSSANIAPVNTTDSSEAVNPIIINSQYDHLQIATTLCFVVGAIRLMMGLFKLGIISVLLSDQMVSAFSCGAAFHVATSQIGSILGIPESKNSSGPLKLIYSWIDLIESFDRINWITFTTSLSAIIILFIYKEFIDPPLKRRFNLPIGIPIDLVILIVSTILSYSLSFESSYHIHIMGDIPSGLPPMSPPDLQLARHLIPDAIAIALVTYAVQLSVGKIFAKKYRYKIRPSQELVALGSADLVSSFFGCYPCSASLSRSPVQEKAGGRTQLASLFSASIILLVLLFLGPYFHDLPKCILGSIILVALKTILMQLGDMITIWRVSRVEGLSYAITFLSVVLLDVGVGLVIGVVVALLMVLVRLSWPSSSLLEHLPNTEIYVEAERFRNSRPVECIRIYRFSCALFFLNAEVFRENLFKLCFGCSYFDLLRLDVYNRRHFIGKITAVVIDCSTISYVDIIGMEIIYDVLNSLSDLNIRGYLAACPATVLDMLERASAYDKFSSKKFPVFPTVHDAIITEQLYSRI
ncbi:solute carrier family 26 member 6-like isoform X2 [Brevipalpus obovatus]|uniref:solute carrier family 26 member 6-like isoform X2 n=1 Tax=Brevipalpus obovatus TaxID=246614 RepID=UPI003D9F53A8